MRAIWRATGLIGGLLTADSAMAQETAVYWGVDLTSNYVFDGLTQTNGDFAFQPWVELEYNGFYAGAWASTVDLGTDNWELDLYLGYRDTLDSGLFWSVGYARYLYDDTGDCCGEIKLELAYPVIPTFVLGTQISFNPETDAWNRKLLASYDFSEQLSVSGSTQADHYEWGWTNGALV